MLEAVRRHQLLLVLDLIIQMAPVFLLSGVVVVVFVSIWDNLCSLEFREMELELLGY